MRRGPLVNLYVRLVDTDWGPFALVATRTGKLVATCLPRPEPTLRKWIAAMFPVAEESNQICGRLAHAVRQYFSGNKVRLDADVDWQGIGGFRRRVLEACRRIPFGTTASYGDLARAAGSPNAARAVGGAMANNPLPLIVPCHRVLRSDGTLGGFSCPQGPSLKERMLRLENPALCFARHPRTLYAASA